MLQSVGRLNPAHVHLMAKCTSQRALKTKRVRRGRRPRGEDRRRKREATRPAPATTPDEMPWREVREVLDAEIAALPEHYRLPAP